MKFRDSLRAQYYLAALEREISSATSQFPRPSIFAKDAFSILCDFSTELSEELDQLLLPTIAYELHKSKKLGRLDGSTPFERYTSFFLDQHGYTSQSRSLTKLILTSLKWWTRLQLDLS